MFAALTGSGLAAAAGLNAWIPFMLVALTARTSDLIELPGDYDWVISDWAIGVGACCCWPSWCWTRCRWWTTSTTWCRPRSGRPWAG